MVSETFFLLKIIEHNTTGTVDYHAVATACGISTGNAARMRYTRLKKKIDEEEKGPVASGDVPTTPTSKTKGKSDTARTKGSNKKRKAVADEDETETPVKEEE